MRVCAALMILVLPLSARGADGILGYLPGPDAGAIGKAEHFVGKKLFDYMDGGAELYLAYGFVDLGIRDYQQKGARATLEVYRMGRPAEAFGIWSQAARGKKVDVSVPAILAPGLLSFFKDRFYVRVVAKSKPDDEFLLALGERVAAGLPGESRPPSEIGRLPKNFKTGSLRYLEGPQTARTLWFDGEGELLLTPGAHAVSALYPVGEDEMQATRLVYPSRPAAQSACRALAGKLKLKPAGDRCRASGKTPDGVFTVLVARDNLVLWVNDAPDLKTARELLGRIR